MRNVNIDDQDNNEHKKILTPKSSNQILQENLQQFRPAQGSRIKTLTLKTTAPEIAIRLAQVQVGNTSENCLNEVRYVYSLYQSRQISKKIYNNSLKSI